MRLLRSDFDVDTRYGGRFVQSIDGLEGAGAGGEHDWFYCVNGVEADVGRRRVRALARRPRAVGLPRLGSDDARAGDRRRLPGAVRARARGQAACRCGSSARAAVGGLQRRALDRLEEVGALALGCVARGARDTETITRLVVARWPQARIVRGASGLEQGPETSGVFARFGSDGRSLDLLDERGEVARTVRPGDGVGIVLAMRPLEEELVWLVTGLDDEGVAAAVRALDEDKLRDAFAVAVDGDRGEASAGERMSLVPVYRPRPSALHAARAGVGGAVLRCARADGGALPAPARARRRRSPR